MWFVLEDLYEFVRDLRKGESLQGPSISMGLVFGPRAGNSEMGESRALIEICALFGVGLRSGEYHQ